MSRRQHSEARRAALMIFGLLAIPILSVTSAALLADVASTTDPAAAAVGIPATFGGLVMGALVCRLGRAVHSGTIAIGAVLRRISGIVSPLLDQLARPWGPGVSPRPVHLFLSTRGSLRGPPIDLR